MMKETWVYRRGDIYLANLGAPVGSQQGGVRPVVVLRIIRYLGKVSKPHRADRACVKCAASFRWRKRN